MDRVIPLDLTRLTVRELNHFLHHQLPTGDAVRVEILNPNGMHNLAVGLTRPPTSTSSATPATSSPA